MPPTRKHDVSVTLVSSARSRREDHANETTAVAPERPCEPVARTRSELFVCGPAALDTVTRRTILAANNPAGRIVTCQPRPVPSSRPDHAVAAMLLDALGARHGARREPAARHWADDVVCWLAAYQPRDVVILDAEFLDAPALASLANLTAQTRSRTWLVLETDPDEEQAQFLDDWCIPANRLPDARRLPTHAAPTPLTPATSHHCEPTTTATSDNPRTTLGAAPAELPVCDPLTFLDTCRRTLPIHQYEWLRPRYLDALRTAHDAISTTTVGDLDQVATTILNVLRSSVTSAHAVAAARACQAVCAEHGIRMSLDTATLTDADTNRRRRHTVVAGASTHRKPTWAALVVLGEMGFTVDEIVAAHRTDFDTATGTLTVAGTTHEIPPVHLPSMRAAQMYHLHQTDGPRQQLVAETGKTHDAAEIGRRLARARHDTGAALGHGRAVSARSARAMLISYGIRFGY